MGDKLELMGAHGGGVDRYAALRSPEEGAVGGIGTGATAAEAIGKASHDFVVPGMYRLVAFRGVLTVDADTMEALHASSAMFVGTGRMREAGHFYLTKRDASEVQRGRDRIERATSGLRQFLANLEQKVMAKTEAK